MVFSPSIEARPYLEGREWLRAPYPKLLPTLATRGPGTEVGMRQEQFPAATSLAFGVL